MAALRSQPQPRPTAQHGASLRRPAPARRAPCRRLAAERQGTGMATAFDPSLEEGVPVDQRPHVELGERRRGQGWGCGGSTCCTHAGAHARHAMQPTCLGFNHGVPLACIVAHAATLKQSFLYSWGTLEPQQYVQKLAGVWVGTRGV